MNVVYVCIILQQSDVTSDHRRIFRSCRECVSNKVFKSAWNLADFLALKNPGHALSWKYLNSYTLDAQKYTHEAFQGVFFFYLQQVSFQPLLISDTYWAKGYVKELSGTKLNDLK